MKCQQHLKAQIYFCLRTPICQSGRSCLQSRYTPEPEYWADVEKITEGAKSALNLILPEVYLEDDNVDERIADIHKNMDQLYQRGRF